MAKKSFIEILLSSFLGCVIWFFLFFAYIFFSILSLGYPIYYLISYGKYLYYSIPLSNQEIDDFDSIVVEDLSFSYDKWNYHQLLL